MTHPPSPADPSLHGKLVWLRELTEQDASKEYASWLNDPVVNQYLETRSVTIDELKTYIREKQESPNAMLFGIFWNENHKHIGNVKLEPIDRKTNEATMGILIGDKSYWGKGVATDATNVLCAYAFDVLKLRAITLGVIAENLAAIRVYEKCGFTTSAVEANAMNHDGKLFDRVVMRKEAL